MSASENTRQLRLEEVENARLLLDQWTQGLAEVLKSMADQKPEVRWQAVHGPFPETAAPGTPPGAELKSCGGSSRFRRRRKPPCGWGPRAPVGNTPALSS